MFGLSFERASVTENARSLVAGDVPRGYSGVMARQGSAVDVDGTCPGVVRDMFLLLGLSRSWRLLPLNTSWVSDGVGITESI